VRAAQDLLFTTMGLIAWNFAVPRMCRFVLVEKTEQAALARRRETVIDAVRTLAAALQRDPRGPAVADRAADSPSRSTASMRRASAPCRLALLCKASSTPDSSAIRSPTVTSSRTAPARCSVFTG
jgi:hypothetical protein